MITDPYFKKVYTTLPKKLSDYWNYYFAYHSKGNSLYLTTQKEIERSINNHKNGSNYFIDSQILLGDILGQLSTKHNFHRQFSELFPGIGREQVLGMQLYTIMLADNLIWVYQETQHFGHMYPHATYYIPNSQDYLDFCAKYNSCQSQSL